MSRIATITFFLVEVTKISYVQKLIYQRLQLIQLYRGLSEDFNFRDFCLPTQNSVLLNSFHFWLSGVLTSICGLLGLLGNILSVAVLAQKYAGTFIIYVQSKSYIRHRKYPRLMIVVCPYVITFLIVLVRPSCIYKYSKSIPWPKAAPKPYSGQRTNKIKLN